MSLGQFSLRVGPEFLREPGIPTDDVFHRLLLYDFVTGQTELLERHKSALDRYVVPYIDSDSFDVAVFVGGLASRAMGTAPAELNPFLAFSRAQSVVRYLEYRSDIRRGRNTLVVRHYGAKRSVGGSENSEFHRSVLVVLARLSPPAIVPETRPPRPIPLWNRFKISLVNSYEGGEIIGFGSFRFEIDYDRTSPNSPEPCPTRYQLLAGGGTVGAPGGGNIGVHSWNQFSVPQMCSPRDFEGRAAVSSVGVWTGRGVGVMTVHLYPRRGSEVMIDNFQTDLSLGAGGSILWGPFMLGWGH